jgi:diadenosine tetraphosphatase ApaH/serine/threonine PP2A family protein phosphatase
VLAALYDIHGNLPALEAVLADAQAAGTDRYLLGGDYASLGAWPVEVLDRLRKLPTVGRLRGNWERWQESASDAPDLPFIKSAMDWVREALGPERIADLAALPETAIVDGRLFCHASPVSDMRSFLPAADADEEELLAGVGQRTVVFGHTHLQFRRVSAGGIELVNPGSVGLPFDGDHRAAYALFGDGHGDVELRRVDYDHRRYAATVRERMQGLGEEVAERIEAALPP